MVDKDGEKIMPFHPTPRTFVARPYRGRLAGEYVAPSSVTPKFACATTSSIRNTLAEIPPFARKYNKLKRIKKLLEVKNYDDNNY